MPQPRPTSPRRPPLRTRPGAGRWGLLLLPLLLGAADGCPLVLGPQEPAGTPSAAPTVDVGGTDGALWRLTWTTETTVTLRSGGQVASATVDAPDASVELLGQSIQPGGLCWRTDTVCPAQVLPELTAMVQPGDPPWLVRTSFNPRGPLSTLDAAAGLAGALEGRELTIPLSAPARAGDPCVLQGSSAVLATVTAADAETEATGEPEDGHQGVARELAGRVTVAYTGACLTLAGAGALAPTATVELSTELRGQRQP